ncbi:hypothetical protein GCM10009721_38480 [Terrabacter tumescens]|uniref:Uncharacterized protein n=1 Tax=Terrabacter tumescens TaxID=60443 RepID=A0ABQ2IG20_9MICO|nr:hypothetical protein GCM10009721_38480 [Terrabacter tumescens]
MAAIPAPVVPAGFGPPGAIVASSRTSPTVTVWVDAACADVEDAVPPLPPPAGVATPGDGVA